MKTQKESENSPFLKFLADVMYGNNLNILISMATPRRTLKKSSDALAYHRARKAIATGISNFQFIKSDVN